MDKKCPGCGEIKPLDAFCRNRRTRDGRACYCKPCHKRRNRESKSRYGGPRNYHLLHRYGITALDVEEMIAEQGGVCAACKVRPAEQVDHDHKTGQVRGILCDGCNGAIALFNEDLALMERALRYLNGEITY